MAKSTTHREDLDMATEILNRISIEDISIDAGYILEFVNENYVPEEVFDEDKLREWAIDHDFVGFDDERSLSEWAENHGYKK